MCRREPKAGKLTENEQHRLKEELGLAMAWDKFGKSAPNHNLFLKDSELDSALRDALKRDSVQFVELLLEYGASFDRLRRDTEINKLYALVESSNRLPIITYLDNKNVKLSYYTDYIKKTYKNKQSEQQQEPTEAGM
ncbi:unnamed protein product [Didymodactylos carnosus]|uniref:Uncharacterized protein n=1 Tax=Didymodactylos carnosus TaxID=1234261 RepID=A0A8S2FU66_9BILA|nr:unnamed protein product [Didymodactylos carnosus]CAF4351102.1 unnamed protein product [Didymodactylos carnosus]